MDDLISRQDVYCILEKMMVDRPLDSDRWVIRDIDKEIKSLPSADRPRGHWVLVNRGLDIYMCDQCGEILQIDRVPIWDYCPVCGAKMGGYTDGRPNQQTGGD